MMLWRKISGVKFRGLHWELPNTSVVTGHSRYTNMWWIIGRLRLRDRWPSTGVKKGLYQKIWKGVPGVDKRREKVEYDYFSSFFFCFRVFGSFSTLLRLFWAFSTLRGPGIPFSFFFSEFSRERPFLTPVEGQRCRKPKALGSQENDCRTL